MPRHSSLPLAQGIIGVVRGRTDQPMMTPALQEKLDQLPATPGVYLMKDMVGDVLYVGKAASLRSRVRSYFQPGADLHPRTRLLVERVRDLDFVIADSELEAIVLEFNLIQKYRPRYNVRNRDDKSYLYIRIDLKEEFPALYLVRQRVIVDDGARYFGPYPSTRPMWDTIRLLRRVFGVCQRLVIPAKKTTGANGFRTASGREMNPLSRGARLRPCLDYSIGRCLGPCAGVVSSEDYRKAIRQVCDFLDGKYDFVLKQLRQDMVRAAEEQRFEHAARSRDQMAALERTLEEQRVVLTAGNKRSPLAEADAIGYAFREDTACMAVIQVRTGRISGQDNFLLTAVSGVPAAEVLNEFVKQHYQQTASLPRRVLLPAAIEDAGAVAELLSRRRGSKVKLEAPQRGDSRDLVGMAIDNAEHHLRVELERESVERRRGQEAVADLQNVLHLGVTPRRVEAFDISNIQGTNAVGSMIVFENGQPKRSDYRRFRIQIGEGEPNDYGMMHEVLSRRLRAAVSGNVKFQHLPDLMLVDGGIGQLNVALRAMESLGLHLPVAALAKEHEEVYLPGNPVPVSLPEHSRALHLLQRVRDEAHRFAISYHRTLRAKEIRESVLDGIPGVGAARKRKLLTHFHSLKRLREAPLEKIASVAGCSAELAGRIAAALADGANEEGAPPS